MFGHFLIVFKNAKKNLRTLHCKLYTHIWWRKHRIKDCNRRLSFSDTRNRPYLNALAHHTQIWKPDLYIIKHGSYKSINPTEVALRVHQNGTIFYTMRRHLLLSCVGDLHIFPFDSPMCTFSIESVSSTRAHMEFHWSDMMRGDDAASIVLSPLLKQHNAYLIHNETLVCQGEEWRGDFSCLKVNNSFNVRERSGEETSVVSR